jgi:hypothetical protein
MSSPWRTGPKIGGLAALPEIVELAKEMLTVEQLERVDERARAGLSLKWSKMFLSLLSARVLKLSVKA